MAALRKNDHYSLFADAGGFMNDKDYLLLGDDFQESSFFYVIVPRSVV
jgi:hypothetical protein